MSNFPLGSDTPDAPWNEPDGPTCEVCGQLGGPRRTCEVCYRKACEGCRKTCDNCGAWTCRNHITEGMCALCARLEQERDSIEDEWRSVRVNGATYPDASAEQVPVAIKMRAMKGAEA